VLDASQHPTKADFYDYLLGENSGLLRAVYLPLDHHALYSNFHILGEQRIPWAVDIFEKGGLAARVRVNSITLLQDEPDLTLPPEAVPAPVILDEAYVSEAIVHWYLPEARTSYVGPIDSTTRVKLGVVVAKNGKVRNVTVLYAGDHSLADVSKQAIIDWRFKPLIVKGQASEFSTMVTVNFSDIGKRTRTP
jgi:hypothetical protein